MNDTYLKLNNQPSGSKSYGEMVTLLTAHYLKYHTVKPDPYLN